MEIFVGNLPLEVNEEKITATFSEFGAVSRVKLLRDRFSNESRGMAFVTMDDAQSGQQAVEKLNGSDMDGRILRVEEARPRASSGGFNRGERRSGGGRSFGGGGNGGGRSFGGGGRSFGGGDNGGGRSFGGGGRSFGGGGNGGARSFGGGGRSFEEGNGERRGGGRPPRRDRDFKRDSDEF